MEGWIPSAEAWPHPGLCQSSRQKIEILLSYQLNLPKYEKGCLWLDMQSVNFYKGRIFKAQHTKFIKMKVTTKELKSGDCKFSVQNYCVSFFCSTRAHQNIGFLIFLTCLQSSNLFVFLWRWMLRWIVLNCMDYSLLCENIYILANIQYRTSQGATCWPLKTLNILCWKRWILEFIKHLF